MISKKEAMLNPRQRPKRPPSEERNSIGLIRICLSSSEGSSSLKEEKIWLRSFKRNWVLNSWLWSHPWQSPLQRRCWPLQYLPPRRCIGCCFQPGQINELFGKTRSIAVSMKIKQHTINISNQLPRWWSDDPDVFPSSGLPSLRCRKGSSWRNSCRSCSPNSSLSLNYKTK